MEVKVKNRGWVKNAAIIFLAVMLVLTFFSNTFMNHSLAEVATQSVTNGSITAKVRGTGTVESNGSYQVKAGATREIRAVMVKEGQEVNQGDVLFVLGEGPSEELDAATENLRQLQLSYQRTAVNMPSFDYSLDERNIEKAKETLASAQAAENSAKAALEQNANVPEAELKAAQVRLDSANQALTDARAELQTRYDAATILRDQAQARLQELLNNKPEEPEEGSEEASSYQQQLAAAQAELDAANALLESLDPSVDPTVKAAQAEVDAAQAELDAILNRAGPYAESYNQAVEARKAAEDELFIFRPDVVGFLKRPAVGGSHGFHCPALGKSVVALVCPVLGGSIGFSQILDLHRGHSFIRTRRDKLIHYVKFLGRVERVAEHSRSGVTALLLIVFQLDGEVFAVFGNIRHRIYVVNLFRLIKPCAEGENIRAIPVKPEILIFLICVCNPVLAVCDSHIVHRRGIDAISLVIIPFLQNGRIVIQAYIVAHFLHHCLACAVFVFVLQLCLIGMRVAFRLAHRDGQKAYARGFVIQAVLGKEVGGEPIALIFRIVC